MTNNADIIHELDVDAYVIPIAVRQRAVAEIKRLRSALSDVHDMTQEPGVPFQQIVQNVAATVRSALDADAKSQGADETPIPGSPESWTDEQRTRALYMVHALAHTDPTEWRSKRELHEEFQEFCGAGHD